MSGEGMPFFVAGWCIGSLIIFGVTRDWPWLASAATAAVLVAALALYLLVRR